MAGATRRFGSVRGRLLPALAAGLAMLATARADRIVWSDGREAEGRLEAGEGGAIRLHDGRQLLSWDVGAVARIGLSPGTQQMERAWTFVEAGKTAKAYSGEPYPTMELLADVQLRDGRTLRGHLMTTVLYLTHDGRTEKVVLKYKLRGSEGQSFTNIVYPRLLAWGGVGATAPSGVHVTVEGAGARDELAAVARTSMTEAEVRRTGPGAFQVMVAGGDVVPAVRRGAEIAVGWRGTAPAAAQARIEQGLRDLKDFFDDRRLLAVAQVEGDPTTCHTLLLLSRAGVTTLPGAASHPWCLEVWKWRLGETTNDITAASRCVLFRGLRSSADPLPTVRLDAALGTADHLENGVVLRTAAPAR